MSLFKDMDQYSKIYQALITTRVKPGTEFQNPAEGTHCIQVGPDRGKSKLWRGYAGLLYFLVPSFCGREITSQRAQITADHGNRHI